MSKNPNRDDERRFTDDEVAIVLKRAASIEDRSDRASEVRGMSITELRSLAQEVGLNPAAIDEAVIGLHRGNRSLPAELLGAPLSAKAVRGVLAKLDEAGLQQLIHELDDAVEATGTVTEALGTVRWTSVPRGHKFDRSTQVAVTSDGDETRIQVAQRYPSSMRIILQAVPALWGGMLGGGIAASAAPGPAAGIAIGIGAALTGLGIGRMVWSTLASRNRRAVEELAAHLADRARQFTTANN